MLLNIEYYSGPKFGDFQDEIGDSDQSSRNWVKTGLCVFNAREAMGSTIEVL